MNLKKALGRENNFEEDDLNIMPVMNLFLILVPFMLLTAVFVKISILEFSLPTADTPASEINKQENNPIVTIIAITENGFRLKTKGLQIPIIYKEGENFNYAVLVENLKKIKSMNQQAEDIIIAPQATIKYEIIIKVMDRCRENGFPNISISA